MRPSRVNARPETADDSIVNNIECIVYVQVILDEACSSPVLTICGDSVQLAARTDAVLLQPDLLVLLADSWRHFETEQVCLRVLLY